MRSLGRITAVRAQAEALMGDTFAAYSPGAPATDADGMESPGWNPQGFTFGRMHAGSRLQSVAAQTVSVGGVDRPVIDSGLRIPVTAPVPSIGWEYVMTAASPLTDRGLIGRRWHVVGIQADTYATARRLNVVEVPA